MMNETQVKERINLLENELVVLKNVLNFNAPLINYKPIVKKEVSFPFRPSSKPKRHYNKSIPNTKKLLMLNNREQAKYLLDLHYFGTNEEKNKVLKDLNLEKWNILSRDFSSLKRKHNFKPAEFGLSAFPNVKGSVGMKMEVERLRL